MIVKNLDTIDKTYAGQLVEAGESYTIQDTEKPRWLLATNLQDDIIAGKATINDLNIKDSLILLTGDIVPLNLDEYKEKRNIEINKRTDELIASGFPFDGETFGSRLEDRVNWGHMAQFKALLTFPADIATIDNKEYSLAEADVMNLIIALATHVNTQMYFGRQLKNAVNAATTEAEVDAVIDNR